MCRINLRLQPVAGDLVVHVLHVIIADPFSTFRIDAAVQLCVSSLPGLGLPVDRRRPLVSLFLHLLGEGGITAGRLSKEGAVTVRPGSALSTDGAGVVFDRTRVRKQAVNALASLSRNGVRTRLGLCLDGGSVGRQRLSGVR